MKIIIIGSGIGGSGIGALIAKETAHEVFLFERDVILGGRCASYEKKDAQGRS
jgi:predicted NAD/FAD-binding protein